MFTALFFLIVIPLALIILAGSLFVVDQQTVRIVERFGKFLKIGEPGLNFKIPFIDSVSAPFDMKLQQLIVQSDTKTLDNVFVRVDVAVQYEVMPDKVYEAFYRLKNSASQITSYVYDSVRSRVPELTIDDVFVQKNEIASSIEESLESHMTEFGYAIRKVLVTDIIPNEKVQAAMNEIQAATRLAQAAQQKGEAEKILVVKKAEAEAESMRLQGIGIANERKAIFEGLKISVETMKEALGNVPEEEVMTILMMTQYLDTLKSIGTTGGSNTIMLPSSPNGLRMLSDEIRTAIISGNAVQSSKSA